MPRKQRVIAAFDFDETLITVDTLPDFLRHSCSLPVFVGRAARALPTVVLFKLHKLSNDTAKERLLSIFLRNMPEGRFTKLCETYAARLDKLADRTALERVKWHQDRGDEVVIVSASAEGWIMPWAKKHRISTVIATKLVADDSGKLTGKLASPNCHGPEKVVRFLAKYPDRSTYTLYMYGDGKSDQQMFELADSAFEGKFA